MTSEPAINALVEAFPSHRRFLITSHARPDGDAVGSVLAPAESLDELRLDVVLVRADESPPLSRTLPGIDRILIARDAREIEPDLSPPAILLECDGIPRTGLAGLDGRCLINIDHHASGRPFGMLNWIDEDACAVA